MAGYAAPVRTGPAAPALAKAARSPSCPATCTSCKPSNRHDQQDPQWQRTYGTRSGVQGTINEFANAHHARDCRYRGLAKTHIQYVLTAIAVNSNRYMPTRHPATTHGPLPPSSTTWSATAIRYHTGGARARHNSSLQDSRQSPPAGEAGVALSGIRFPWARCGRAGGQLTRIIIRSVIGLIDTLARCAARPRLPCDDLQASRPAAGPARCPAHRAPMSGEEGHGRSTSCPCLFTRTHCDLAGYY
jgi:hypothetical protein